MVRDEVVVIKSQGHKPSFQSCITNDLFLGELFSKTASQSCVTTDIISCHFVLGRVFSKTASQSCVATDIISCRFFFLGKSFQNFNKAEILACWRIPSSLWHKNVRGTKSSVYNNQRNLCRECKEIFAQLCCAFQPDDISENWKLNPNRCGEYRNRRRCDSKTYFRWKYY